MVCCMKLNIILHQLRYWQIPPEEMENIPWRTSVTPYRVYLAEFLLIRTKVAIVSKYYEEFFNKYPVISTLAKSDLSDLEEDISVFGFKKRAYWIKMASQYILENYNGEIPNDKARLIKIPGIGPYTSSAICAFGYNSVDIPSDVNLYRLISRITGIMITTPSKGNKEIRYYSKKINEVISDIGPMKLLDFSRLICQKNKPKCYICPLKNDCTYFNQSVISSITSA
jgi:A/G-specific adenine glycosylase